MLEFRNLNVTLQAKEILTDVSFTLPEGEITAVVGRNGSGKSTLISCVTGRVNYRGEILLKSQDIRDIPSMERGRKISVLPQILPKTAMTVEELVSMGRLPYLDIGKRMSETDKKCVADALSETGLAELAMRYVSTLSGGERQKAYLAMILAQNTEILLLDEPTTYMDMDNEAEFLKLVSVLKEKYHKTVLLVMHNLSKAVEIADRILVLEDGRSRFFGKTEDCVEQGVIEEVFRVRRSVYAAGKTEGIVYYR